MFSKDSADIMQLMSFFADLYSKILDAPPPSPTFFIFMQFSANSTTPPPSPVWEILYTPLFVLI